jgi:hypothetical protein
MKKVLLFVIIFLSGCASRGFDPVEYDYATNSVVLSTRMIHQCDVKTQTYYKFLDDLNSQTMYLYEYERNRSDNASMMRSVSVLRDMIIDVVVSGDNHTVQYCKHKNSAIQSVARTIAKTIRMDNLYVCRSDAMDRLKLYQESFDAVLITRDEYLELVNDLTGLVTVDTSMCTIEQREALIKTVSVISDVISAIK